MAIGDFTTFSYTGALQTMTLLAGKRYKIECWGAQGGYSDSMIGGYGGYAVGEISIAEDTTANIYVGGKPTSNAGGWNGGGNGSNNSGVGGGGGGASDVRIGGTALSNRKIIAGGGGGASNQGNNGAVTGAGGGANGNAGYDFGGGKNGLGGTQSAGGANGGALGQGGNAINDYANGGGGGGYYGGGGARGYYSGGGGGSSLVTIDAGNTLTGQRTGHGQIKITQIDPNPTKLTVPTTYSYTGSPQGLFLKKGKYKLECFGGQGGLPDGGANYVGGKGGYCKGEITFLSDVYLYLYVGGKGIDPISHVATGGWNGGANGGRYASGDTGGAGGGASDIRVGGTALSNRIIVAGGGGGQSNQIVTNGIQGAGGGLEGVNGSEYGGVGHGVGGTQSAGGTLNGALGVGGTSGDIVAGGGGGGYYGGGGGGDYDGGGGGSSYYGTLDNPETIAGVNTGNGYIIITPKNNSYNGFPQII